METTHPPDAELARAEATIADLLDRADRLGDESLAVEADKWDRFIATTRPTSLVGASVKIRRLLDRETGIAVGTSPTDLVSLEQVLGLLQSIIGEPQHRTRPRSR